MQLVERLAEGAGVAQVSAGHDDPVGRLPAQRFQHAEHDRLLPFQPEGIDAVDQVDAQLLADLLDAGHGVVEVAGDLHRQRAVVERLRKLAVGDLARADEDHRLHQPRDGAIEGQRGAGVAGRGAGGAVAPTSRAWLKAADMPLSLKLPEGFIPSYCKYSRPGAMPDVAGPRLPRRAAASALRRR